LQDALLFHSRVLPWICVVYEYGQTAGNVAESIMAVLGTCGIASIESCRETIPQPMDKLTQNPKLSRQESVTFRSRFSGIRELHRKFQSGEKMTLAHIVRFGPYRLDPVSAQLFQNRETVPLPPKAFAVLVHLIERRGQLVGKDRVPEPCRR
jgi:hypothetical protein